MTGNNPRGRPRQAGRITGGSATRAASALGAADRDNSLRTVPAAFYGRTARAAGSGDSEAERYRQLALCRSAAAACGAQVTAEFFDEDCRAGDPWQHRPQGRSLLGVLSGPGRLAGAVVVADPWRLLPRRPAPDEPGILARLAFRRVQLVLADSGLVISTAGEYALLGRLLTGPAASVPPGGATSWPSFRDRRARRSRPGQPAAGLRRRSGEPR
jgi:hypothetical protein